MCKVEFLGALEAEKLTKQKWEQYCGTPCKKQRIYESREYREHLEYLENRGDKGNLEDLQ